MIIRAGHGVACRSERANELIRRYGAKQVMSFMKKKGPCAKTRVECFIRSRDGKWVFGSNDCNNPQNICPRAPGEGYEKCSSVCQQEGHAEVQAISNAEARGIDLKGATALISGHYRCCRDCAVALRDAGVDEIIIEVKAREKLKP